MRVIFLYRTDNYLVGLQLIFMLFISFPFQAWICDESKGLGTREFLQKTRVFDLFPCNKNNNKEASSVYQAHCEPLISNQTAGNISSKNQDPLVWFGSHSILASWNKSRPLCYSSRPFTWLWEFECPNFQLGFRNKYESQSSILTLNFEPETPQSKISWTRATPSKALRVPGAPISD